MELSRRARCCVWPPRRLSAEKMMRWFGCYTFDAHSGDVLRRGTDWRCTPRCWWLNFVSAKPIAYGPNSRRWGSGGPPTRWLAPFEPLAIYADIAIATRAGLDTSQVIDNEGVDVMPASCTPLCNANFVKALRLVGAVAAALLAIGGTVLAIAALASSAWLVHVEAGGIRHEYGLFNACVVELGAALRCSAATEANGWGDAALNRGRSAGAALAVLATLVLFTGALLQLARLAVAVLLYHPALGERALRCAWQRALNPRRSSIVALEGGSDGFIALGGDGAEPGREEGAPALGGVDAAAEDDEEEGAAAAVVGNGDAGFVDVVLEEKDLLDGSGGGADDATAAGVVPALRPVSLHAVVPQGMVAQATPSADLRWACVLHIVGVVAAVVLLLGDALLLACWCIWEGAAKPVLWAGDVVDGAGAALVWCSLASSLAAVVAQQVG